ncbi:MAG: divergent PAP2 family protein, partial [Spirochaetia bacterium]
MDSIPLPAASLLVALGVQVLCQLFKFVVYSIRDHRVSPHYLVTAGGMPSAHAAFVTALTTAVGLRSGIDSDIFAVAFVFAAIVAYDAYRLRGHVQDHARWINRLQAEVNAGTHASANPEAPAGMHGQTPAAAHDAHDETPEGTHEQPPSRSHQPAGGTEPGEIGVRGLEDRELRPRDPELR